jgi:hypothetical protein
MWQEWKRRRIHVRILVGKPNGKIPLEGPRRRRVDNIKMDLREDRGVWTGLIWLSGGLW